MDRFTASDWLQSLVRRLDFWTAPFLSGGEHEVDDTGRVRVRYRWHPPVSYREFLSCHRDGGKQPGPRDEAAIFGVCSCRGHLLAAQRWSDTCAGCGAAIPAGAVGLAGHAPSGADGSDFVHTCGTQNLPTQAAVPLTQDAVARQVRARIAERMDHVDEYENVCDPQFQRFLPADGLDSVCADLFAGLRDRMHTVVSGEVEQENQRRRHRLDSMVEAALRNLPGYRSLTELEQDFQITVTGDQPARLRGSTLSPDLPVVPGSNLTIHAWDRQACPPEGSPDLITVDRAVPDQMASSLIINHNATLATVQAR